MTADRNELDMTELDLRELMDAAGGAAHDAAVELAKYIEELCVKYNCVGLPARSSVKTVHWTVFRALRTPLRNPPTPLPLASSRAYRPAVR